MQERVSQSLQFRLGEIDPVSEPGTIIFINDAILGIIKVVSSSGFPSQVADPIEYRMDSRIRKTYQVSLLSCELRHRDFRSAWGDRVR